MINLIRRDMLVSYLNKSSLLLLLAYVPFTVLFIGPEDPNKAFLFVTFSFVFIMTRIPFIYEIKDKPHIFIQSLPVKKRDIVISKYLTIFVNYLLGTIYTLVYMWIMSLIGLLDVDKLEVFTILSTFGFTVVSLSILLPTHFRFSPKVANYVNMFIYLIILNFIAIDADAIFKILSIDFYNIYNTLMISGLVLAIYLLSIIVSISLYETRKFY